MNGQREEGPKWTESKGSKMDRVKKVQKRQSEGSTKRTKRINRVQSVQNGQSEVVHNERGEQMDTKGSTNGHSEKEPEWAE